MLENYIMYILMIENKGYLNPLTFSINIIIFKFWPALLFGLKKDKVFFSKKSFLIKKIPQYIKKKPKTIAITSKMDKKICQTFFSLTSLKILLLEKMGYSFIYWGITFYKKKSLKKLILGQKNKDGQNLKRMIFIKKRF